MVIPTKSADFTASLSFFSSKVSAAKSNIVTLSPSFSRIFAIYSNPSGGAIAWNSITSLSELGDEWLTDG